MGLPGCLGPAAGAQGAPLLAAIRVSCTGSCRVSNKANDTAWVAEEGYFNSVLLLADKGEYVWGLSALLFKPRSYPPSFAQAVALCCW